MASSCTFFCAAGAFLEQQDLHSVRIMILAGIFLAGLALANLLRARAFVIDREQGQFEVFERRFMRKGTRALFPVKALEMFVETWVFHTSRSRDPVWTNTSHRILITVKGSDPLVFVKVIRGPEGPRLARTLAQDLDRPLRKVNRDT